MLSRKSWGALLLAAAGLAVVMLALPWVPGLRPRDLLLDKWRSELANADHERIPLLFAQIASLDEHAIGVLVEALGSSREDVSLAAEEALLGLVDDWRSLAPADSSPKVARLADELAARVVRWPAERRRAAFRLARQLLRWPIDSDVINGARLIADTETVLRSVEPVTDAAGLSTALADDGPPPENAGPVVTSLSDSPPAANRAANAEPPRQLDPQPTMNHSDDSREQATAGKPRGLANLSPAPFFTRREPLNRVEPRVGLADLSFRELMRRLYDDNPAVEREAINELRRRGFQPIHLRLAYRLAHPDVAIRRQFAEDLPAIDVDSRPWLLWLSHDDAAEVRAVATSILATSQDPRLQRRLSEVAAEESNPLVRRRLDEHYQAQRSGSEPRFR